MRLTEDAIRGVVIDVKKDELSIRTELGSLTIQWPHREELKLGERVLIFYDYEKDKVKDVVREAQVSEHVEEVEREEPFMLADEEIDYEGIFDLIEGRELNG